MSIKTAKEKKTFNLRRVLLIGTALLVLLLQVIEIIPGFATPFGQLEYSVRDTLMRMRGSQTPSRDIVIVAIDDFSFNWTGYRWPWPRSYYAGIVDQIITGGGKVVGLDLFLFAPDAEAGNDQVLAEALGKAPAAVTVSQITKDPATNYMVSSLSQPLPAYMDVLAGTGITAFTRDEDAIVRGIQAYDTYQDRVYYNWAFEMARLYMGADEPSNPSNTSLQFNGGTVPLHSGQILVNYAGPAGTYPTYSASNVHDGVTLEENPDAFRGKIVLIGATTVTLQDVYPTPYDSQVPTPGVEVVANAIDTIINGKYLTEAPPWAGLLLILLAAIAAVFISRSQRPVLTVTLMGLAMLGYLAVNLVLFTKSNFLLPIVFPLLMLFLGVVIPTLEQAVSQELEKRRVRNLFSRFIAPEMVDQMVNTQDINTLNKRANLTILFSDIRGFTTLSEKLSPEGVVNLLNPYLETMTAVIHKHGGTVDKYEGDAIVAFFGEPVSFEDHAARTVRAAVDMLKALDELSAQWLAEKRVENRFNIGVGVNTGEVFVGLLGSKERINYTIIGDNANLAARLQDLTKTYSWPILISESTYQAVKDEFETEFADSVTVKGKTKPVNVYKVLGRKGAAEAEKVHAWQV
jgi:adenylate cyclase